MYDIYGLIAGDILRRWKNGVWHWGIYLGEGKVLHNTPKEGEHVSQLADFSAGEKTYFIRPDSSKKSEILHRSSEIVASPKKYSYLWRNCEHTLYQAMEGTPRSPTAKLIVGITALVTGIVVYKYRKQIISAIKEAA